MPPITHRASAPLLHTLALLALLAGGLTAGGCDASEDPNLLNPPLPDSTHVRVVNLIRNEPVSLTLSTIPAARGLASFQVSSFSQFFFQEYFPIYIESFGKIDTLRDQQLGLSVENTIHVTYFVAGTDSGRSLIPFSTSSGAETDLKAAGHGRLYLVNGVPGQKLFIKRGCRAGDTLYANVNPLSSGGVRDLPVGEYALYLFKEGGTIEEASAHVTIDAGEVTYLIAADDGSGMKLYELDASAAHTGLLMEVPPETRTTADVEILNALDGGSLDARLLGIPNPVATALQPRAVSPPVSITACTDSNGDTLEVTVDGTDIATFPIRVGVGSRTLAAVYATNAGTRMLTLDRTTPAPKSDTAYVRGVNLSRTASSAAVILGAGAPQGVATDFRPFGTLKTGDRSNYVPLPAGLYPLSLQHTSTGAFLDGGLQNLATGFYTLLIVEENGAAAIYFLRDDVPGASPQRLESLGRRALFFSLASGTVARFDASTSIGTVVIDTVPYSYVFQTIMPTEPVTITSPGIGQSRVDFTAEGYTIGATGTPGNYDLVSFPLPASLPRQSEAGVRFLNAVPGAGPFNIEIGSQETPLVTNLTFGTPSNTTIHEPRRYSFTITLPADNDTVASIQSVQLSGGRNYLLVIGPKGATSGADSRYGTLWMQE